jgi:hypothetical protein
MATPRAIVRSRWVRLVGAGTLGALLTACTAIEGLDGLEVGDVGAGTDAGSGGGPDGRVPGDGADGGSSPGRDSGSAGDSANGPGDSSVDSATALDATAPDSAAPDSAPPPNAPCVPLGVEPCAGSHENCVPDPNLPDADPLDPPSVCLPIQGAGLGEGQPCVGSAQCAQGLDCIGTQGGTYACQWMCYDPLTAIIVGPPFDAGVLSSQPGRGGCPPFETCTSTVNGYPTWLSVCSGM